MSSIMNNIVANVAVSNAPTIGKSQKPKAKKEPSFAGMMQAGLKSGDSFEGGFFGTPQEPPAEFTPNQFDAYLQKGNNPFQTA